MALSRHSILHYWDALYGVTPIVGGSPVFSRNGGATFQGRERLGRTVVARTPRQSWATLDGVRRPVLQLEPARTNRLLYSEAFEQWYSTGSVTINSGFTDPFGGTAARLVGTSSNQAISLAQTLSAGLVAVSVFMRRSSGQQYFGLYDLGSPGGWRCIVTVRWDSSGTPSLSTAAGSGTLLPVEDWSGGWYRLGFLTTTSTAGSHGAYLYPSGGLAAGDVFAFGYQVEEGPGVTGYIPTSGTPVSRTLETVHFSPAPAAQALAVYQRLVVSIPSGSINGRFFSLGQATDGELPRFLAYLNGSGNPAVYYQNSGGNTANSISGISVESGDTLEILGILQADGSARGVFSRNGAPVVVGNSPAGPTGGLSGAFGRVHMNSVGTAEVTAGRYAELKIFKLADFFSGTDQGRMDEARALVLGPSGDLL
ncbi:MAG TPA: hypothetical protein VGR37_09025 [Longimicrobiaceae bacterium]|nr:hypothetical protein [Longimicrobiaceae bacterium]